MGSSQSSHASATPKNQSKEKGLFGSKSVRGRKSTPLVVESVDEAPIVVSKRDVIVSETPKVELISNVLEESMEDTDNYSLSSSDEENEEDEELLERLRVLEDARNLKKLAEAFLHPETPVQVDAIAMGRNYFTRPSAPPQESVEESEEGAAALADLASLKQLATDYAHPEFGVETSDPTACGRSYYDRASAFPQITEEEAEEASLVLQDAAALQKAAHDYLHPEDKVVSTDGAAFGRNYFDRPSAVEQETEADAEERVRILAEGAALKKLAVDYAHPEAPLEVDAAACGRSYFDRPSAEEQEDCEESEERARILAEASALKKLAVDYAHPEMSVEADAEVSGRNYFDRPSADEQEETEDAEERAQILAEAAALKKLAVDYAHPEMSVEADAEVFGRNYFNRPSAGEQGENEDAQERAQVLAEAAALKKLAVDFCHPEMPVSGDAEVFGRNYFDRPSAVVQDEVEEEERARVLADAAALKKLAVDFLHPEKTVEVDSTVFGRNYFNRPSAFERENKVDTEERALALAEAAALKKLAADYAHPEAPVEVDATVFGRNYFNRPSTVEQEEDADAEERIEILAEAAALKKLAANYAHPEMPVETDPTSFGRNYFSRPSAVEEDDAADAEERVRILAEAAALKKLADNFAHPEKPVETDPTSFGRNYFGRTSAIETETQEQADERAVVVAEAAALKELAGQFAHPEIGVTATDPAAFGRSFFSRPSSATHAQEPAEPGKDDHFVADEKLEKLRDKLQEKTKYVASDKNSKVAGATEGSDEGNLSRSPSSVMLFGLEDNQAF